MVTLDKLQAELGECNKAVDKLLADNKELREERERATEALEKLQAKVQEQEQTVVAVAT